LSTTEETIKHQPKSWAQSSSATLHIKLNNRNSYFI